MEEDKKQKITEEELKDLPIQAESIGFEAGEMILCAKCARKNPPTRLKCFYCNGELELSAEQTENHKPALRKLENWEKGFNLIYRPAAELPENTAEIAKAVCLNPDFLSKVLAAQKSLPLVRAESEAECTILQKKFGKFGIETSIVSDESLAADNLPKRLRGMDFADEKLVLILFNADEIVELRPADICLMVTGALFQKAVESTEKRRKGESKILETSEIASDESLIDIYAKDDACGFRVLTKGFDFSCLGAQKGILARENLQKLAEKLCAFAPDAIFVSDYLSVREILGEVWEIEQTKDSQGLKRRSFGGFDLANTALSNNAQQFTKYSRLQRQII